MLNEKILERMRSLLTDSLSKTEGWQSMSNEFEMYFKIQTLVVNSFECTLTIMPPQITVKVQAAIGKLSNCCICEYEDLKGFLAFAQILSTGLLADLHDKKIHDFAAPHKIVGVLDRAIRLNEDHYDEVGLPFMGASLNLGLFELKHAMENTDWRKGWGEA